MTVNYMLILIVLLLFAGLGVDAGILEWRYLQMATAARASAISGSLALQRGGSSSAISSAGLNSAALNGFTNGVNGVAVVVQNPPTSGQYANNNYSVTANIKQSVATSFMGLAGFPTVALTHHYDHPGSTPVSMTSSFNAYAIFKDTTSVTNGGLDSSNYAFSANALDSVRTANGLGALLSWRGNLFFLGQPDVASATSNATVALTSGNFSQLLILATTGFGPVTNAAFVVHYSDSSTATSSFSMSDWCINNGYTNEVEVQMGAYRLYNTSGASYSCKPIVFGYTINLLNTKTIASVTLPNTTKVVVLAMDLVP